MRPLSFQLLDPLRQPFRRPRRVANSVPRLFVPGFTQRFPVAERRPPSPGDPVDATRLGRRLEALASALDDLPRQARRFARWRARRDGLRAQNRGRDAAGAQNGNHREAPGQGPNRAVIRRVWPLRLGRPPGQHPSYGRRAVHEVYDVLSVVQGLAFWALEQPDTS